VARFLPLAHRGARVIGTDTLRISIVLHVSSDDQEREQGSEDNPKVNAHQSASERIRAPLSLSEIKSGHIDDAK
jgi:hypothetical protein